MINSYVLYLSTQRVLICNRNVATAMRPPHRDSIAYSVIVKIIHVMLKCIRQAGIEMICSKLNYIILCYQYVKNYSLCRIVFLLTSHCTSTAIKCLKPDRPDTLMFSENIRIENYFYCQDITARIISTLRIYFTL